MNDLKKWKVDLEKGDSSMKYFVIVLMSFFTFGIVQAQTIPAEELGDYTCYNIDEENLHCYLEGSEADLDMDNNGILDSEDNRMENEADVMEEERDIIKEEDLSKDQPQDEGGDPEQDDDGLLDEKDDGLLDNNPPKEPGDDDKGF